MQQCREPGQHCSLQLGLAGAVSERNGSLNFCPTGRRVFSKNGAESVLSVPHLPIIPNKAPMSTAATTADASHLYAAIPSLALNFGLWLVLLRQCRRLHRRRRRRRHGTTQLNAPLQYQVVPPPRPCPFSPQNGIPTYHGCPATPGRCHPR